ncbi:MAG: hypothetical protein KBC15_04270 [Candidatus Levybacteria bacterium]|nr:hypothetical protein [Candidatus Levybacteria bacterium]
MNTFQHSYVFVLGRYPDFSTLEIKILLEKLQIGFIVEHESDAFLVIKCHELPADTLKITLGGTIKMGEIYDVLKKPVSLTQINNYLTSDQLFIKYFTDISEKVHFGLSFYTQNADHPLFTSRFLTDMAHHLKNHLDSQGFHSRFPRQMELALSSVSVDKNKLLTLGAEILMFETADSVLIGKTLWVQDYESFSKRDFGRPLRDMESGIMPPKIARMMLNITNVGHDEAILDPFCGSGTIIQEAILLEYSDITGSDISKKAIHDTTANVGWLEKNLQTKSKSVPTIIESDVVSLCTLTDKRFKAIITEPYMGPNIQERRSIQAIQDVQDELLLLYKNTWTAYLELLRPEGIVTMILPAFLIQKKLRFMDILTFITGLGFEQVPLSTNERGSIVVGNTHDFVLREIVQYRKQ